MKLMFWKSDPCADAEGLIQKSLDVALNPAERKRLDRHLATCESCRQAWDDYKKLSRTADKWVSAASTDPGDDFTLRVMAELGLSAEAKPLTPSAMPTAPGSRPAFRINTGWAVAGVVAIVVLAAAGSFLPSIAHLQAQLPTYTPTVSTDAVNLWRPDVVSAWTSLVSTSKAQATEVLSTIGSMSWPLYAFLIALAANVVMASAVRQRRRAL